MDQKNRTIDELLDRFVTHRINRRQFLHRASAVVGLAAAHSILAACASGQFPAVSAPAGGAAPTPAPAGPIKMVGWGYRPEVVEDNVNRFMKAYDEEVKYELTTGGNYHQTVETKMIGGEKPWVMYSESEYLYRWWKAGFVQDVEEVLDRPAAFYKEAMYPANVEHLSLPNGKLAGLPYYSGYIALIYNKDHLDQANLQPPATWEELMEQCRKIKSKGIAEHPYLSAQGHDWASLSWSIFGTWYSEGEPVFDKDNNPTFQDGGVAFRKVIEMHKQWYDEGITPPDILTQEGESVPAFMSGRHTYMMIHDYDQQNLNLGDTSKVKGLVGNALVPGSTHQTFSWTACYLMGRQDVDQQRAWNLMQWLGGKNKDGDYVGNKRFALEAGLGCPYREVMEDPEVIEAWSQWRDMKVHGQQLENSKGRAVEKTLWFPEWNWQMMTEVQEYIMGKKEIGDVIKDLYDLAIELKGKYPT